MTNPADQRVSYFGEATVQHFGVVFGVVQPGQLGNRKKIPGTVPGKNKAIARARLILDSEVGTECLLSV